MRRIERQMRYLTCHLVSERFYVPYLAYLISGGPACETGPAEINDLPTVLHTRCRSAQAVCPGRGQPHQKEQEEQLPPAAEIIVRLPADRDPTIWWSWNAWL